MSNDAPRRTPPPIDPDFYGWFGTLTEEESATRLAVRRPHRARKSRPPPPKKTGGG